jgi:predicted dehydrogenase
MADEITRREFLKATSGAAVAASLGVKAPPAKADPGRRGRWERERRQRGACVAASEKITIGIVGLSGRGFGHHMQTFSQFPDVQIGAVCDVYDKRLDHAVAFTGGKAKGYKDFRQLVEQKDLDAVIVATPPHWHPLVTLAALEAGKDVLCEKPMCRFPAEGRLMVDFVRKYNRITQVGTQIHATAEYHQCVDIVRSGALGKITSVTNFCTMNDNSEGLGNPPDESPLPGLDWNMWLGPAPEVPFNIGRFRDGMHRYFKDYVDSWLHELGPHIIDLPFWALEPGHPTAIAASGGRFATTSMADVPDTLQVLWEFPGMTMTWNLMQANAFHFGVGGPGAGRHNGIIFHGKDATLAIVNYGTPQVLDRDGAPIAGKTYPQSVPPSPGHEREFLDSIKSRKECSCSFAYHLPQHTAMNLAHLSLRLGRKLHWDPEKWQVVADKEATAQLTPHYRAPWKLPSS